MEKRFFQLACLLLACFQFIGQIAHANCCGETEARSDFFEKVYVEPEQVAMSSEGMFLKRGEDWFPIPSLFSDRHGLFTYLSREGDPICRAPYILCRNCRRCVHERYNICPLCEKPT